MARKKKAGKDNNERWLLTYADLITLLMVFFVLLFAMSKTDSQKFQELAQSLHSALNPNIFTISNTNPVALPTQSGGPNSIIESQIFTQIRTIIQQVSPTISSSQVSVNYSSDGIEVTLSGDMLFYNGTDIMKPNGILILSKLAPILNSIPNNLEVQGNTDNVPVGSAQYPTNWELSAARAVVVVRYLSEQLGVAPQRLSAIAYSQYHPIVPNTSRANQAMNRRAVIVILYGSNAQVSPTATP